MQHDTNDTVSLQYQIREKLCFKCQTTVSFFDWCKSCKLEHFQLNYGKYPSGHDKIDKFLENNYCKSKLKALIEWIPYSKFQSITHIFNEEYSKLYGATLNGYICGWDKDKLNWSRGTKELKVILRNFESLDDLFDYKDEV